MQPLDPGVIIGLVALLGAVGTPFIAALLGRRRETSADARLDYDEIQEDLQALRVEFRAHKRECASTTAWQGAVIRHVDNEVVELRQAIEARTVPPLLPRKPWPSEATFRTAAGSEN